MEGAARARQFITAARLRLCEFGASARRTQGASERHRAEQQLQRCERISRQGRASAHRRADVWRGSVGAASNCIAVDRGSAWAGWGDGGRKPLVPDFISQLLYGFPDFVQAIVWYGVIAVILFVSVILCMAFLTWWERRVLGSMHVRIGPNRVGPNGLLQPFADVFKLMFKEIVIPSRANKFLFIGAPILAVVPALCTWAVVPLWPGFSVANVNAGLLYVLAL